MMRKWTLFLGCYFALCLLLAACAADAPEQRPVPLPEETRETLTEEETAVEGLPALYLTVLNDLWSMDSGLNADISMAAVDLSSTSLTEGEQATVALLFGEAHSVQIVQGSYAQLKEQGYILEKDGFPYWEDGCLFSITESENAGGKVTFDAEKWRSGLGAYFLTDCTARKGLNGWSAYKIGAQAIS